MALNVKDNLRLSFTFNTLFHMIDSRIISLKTAQTLAVVKQGLAQRPSNTDKRTLLDIIHQIGLLQLDTISVVARSHYLVMLSRAGLYDRIDLDALLYPDQHLFQQWAHAACYIPIKHYDYFAPIIWARREWPIRREEERFSGLDPQAIMDSVLAEIRAKGPMCSRDFDDPREKRGTWWSYKPAKHALSILYDRGQIMVQRRENFQIYYDLAERVYPPAVEPPVKTMNDYQRWGVERGLYHMGVATSNQVADYHRIKKPLTRQILTEMVEKETAVPIMVEDWKKQAYIHPDNLPLLEQIELGQYQPELTTFLSPFDNLTWYRDRLLALFGFDYKLEIYVPAAKRKYGYYVLPILHNGRFAGRLDPKADRKTKTMIIRHIYLEPGEVPDGELVEGIVEALREFMIFHGSEKLVIEYADPAPLKAAIEQRLQDLRRQD